MIITSLVILTVTYFSGRHYRKKAISNLSETGKQKEAQSPRPKVFLGSEFYNEKGRKYRVLVWAIVILGLILAVVGYFIHF
jgi:hypothetical protein